MRRFAVLAALHPALAAAEPPTVTVGGYLEAFYQAHFQNPSNRITNLRGFDDRSRTFTLSNVALGASAEKGPMSARIVLQVGHTPGAYYADEPDWKHVQTATLAGQLPGDWVLEAGLFASPIGPEVLAIHDNLNWSRSNLFVGLPVYHTGVTLARGFASGWTAKLHVYNGWDRVVDNNAYPSVAASATYTAGTTVAQVMYFGGIERVTGAAEGNAWRHLVDAYAFYPVTDRVLVGLHGNAGLEPNAIGRSGWLAGALYARVEISNELFVAARGDYFYERRPDAASAIFWPTPWIASGTATVAYRPAGYMSVRLEYRHDQADGDAFFGGTVAVDATTMAFVPNRNVQDTITLGATTWF